MTDDKGATGDATGTTITATAKALGVSVRTVQRRLDSGALRSIERDGRRLVLLDSTATPRATEGDNVTRQTATGDAPAIALLVEQQRRDREEITFLRGLVEQRDRDAAEMRAALRKALDNAPRQLTAGTIATAETAQNGTQIGATPDRAGENRAGLKSPETFPVSDAEFDDIDALIHKVFSG